MFKRNELTPNAVFCAPDVFALNAVLPTAVLFTPVVLPIKAPLPKAVLLIKLPPPVFHTLVPSSVINPSPMTFAPVNLATWFIVPLPVILLLGIAVWALSKCILAPIIKIDF